MGNEANSRLESSHQNSSQSIEFPLGLPWEIFQHILSVCAVKDFLTLFCINSIWNTSIRSSSLLQRRRLFIDEGRKLTETYLATGEALKTFNPEDKLLIAGMRGAKKKLILAQIGSLITNKAAGWTLPTGSIPRFFGKVRRLVVVLNSCSYDQILAMRDFLFPILSYTALPVLLVCNNPGSEASFSKFQVASLLQVRPWISKWMIIEAPELKVGLEWLCAPEVG